jgi:RimJ/RimL family protein N-acetyltransferase
MVHKFPFHSEITLENEWTFLRPMDQEDFDAFWSISGKHRDLLRYSPKQINTEDLLQAYMRAALDERSKGQRYAFTIIDKSTNRVVGSSSYMGFSETNSRVEIGSTWLDPAVQGTGLNRQNKKLMLAYAFETCGFERVELKTDSRNMQSQKAILKIGAQYEGRMRSHTLMYDGYRRDTAYFGILKSDWPAVKTLLTQ